MIVIDTHVWVWWVDNLPLLKSSVRDRIDRESDVRVSAISLLEIATAVSLGRLVLRPSPPYWLEIAQSAEQVRIEPLTARSAWNREPFLASFTAIRQTVSSLRLRAFLMPN